MNEALKTGRPLGANALLAIRLVGKVGFICRATWSQFFARGNERWQRRQLQHLIKNDFLSLHRNLDARDIFVLGRAGVEILLKEKIFPVAPPIISNMSHDRIVMQTLFRLNDLGIVRNWFSEAELKKNNVVHSQLKVRNNKIKYPDAIGTISIAGKDRIVAFEYERERKSFSRYREILFSYAQLTQFSMILYICESASIRKAIEKTLNQLALNALSSRMGFVDAEIWKTKAEEAPITVRERVLKLNEICQRVAS